MKKIKYFIITLIFLGSLFFLLGPEVLPENQQFDDSLNAASKNDVVIIFNSGGWGNTSPEEAKDFAPIIEGIQKNLNDWGYKSVVIPYTRTKEGFLGEITGIKEIFQSFPNQAQRLSEDINKFLAENPGKKLIIAGLSNGAVFTNETAKRISQKGEKQIYAIEIGSPFWERPLNSENILYLNNKGKDPLSVGEMKTLILNLFKASFKWISAKISGKELAFSGALYLPGHEYSWPEVKSDVISFLGNKLK